jgi:hypothetical protein
MAPNSAVFSGFIGLSISKTPDATCVLVNSYRTGQGKEAIVSMWVAAAALNSSEAASA